jgi:4-amino-4-deoxy-L-arabinose transferase-like glycosyltransferase
VKTFLRSSRAPLALAILWLAFSIWARPLAVPDEGRYVGVAWHMLTSGNWLVPQLDGLPYFHKPPLFYWITAGALSVFGPHEWAARLAPLIGAVLGSTALFLFARRWFGEREARLALLALVTQPLFFLGGQYANLDMLVAGCITATVLAFAHAALLQEQGERSPRALAAGYLFAALGVLAKGLIGFVLPGLVLVAWLLLRRQWRVLLKLLWLPGIVLFFVVAAPWFIAMQQRFPEFGYYFFVVQHFSRFATSGFNNQQPWYFYPVVLGVLALPWSVWMLAGIRRGPVVDPARRALRLLLWVWLAAMVGFFTLPASKLVGYIFPATWPLALLAADAFVQRAGSLRATRLWRVSAGLAILTCLVAVVVITVLAPGSNQKLSEAMRPQMQPEDQVVFLQGFYFDMAFNTRLRAPVVVVDDWDDPAVYQRDNWRKELADAGHFAPDEARRLLRKPAEVPQLLCAPVTTWVVGGAGQSSNYEALRTAQLVATAKGTALWRVAPVKPGSCAGKPSGNSADKS